jgi:hypothetical protein
MGQINLSKILNYVLIGIVVVMMIILIRQCNKPQPQPLPPTIQQLHDNKQQLDDNTTKVIDDHKTTTDNRVTNVKQRNKKHGEDIKRIPNFCDPVRDSIWARLNSSKDSLPTRYWDLLEQAAGR